MQAHLEELRKGLLSGLSLEMLHGQMPPEEKQAAMLAFRDGKVKVLVATTVVEVGVDVPNATVMLIENAGNFGLWQPRRFVGRVGRGEHASHCLLVGDSATEEAAERMQSLVDHTSGFEIAEIDLNAARRILWNPSAWSAQFKLADIAGELEMLQITRQDRWHYWRPTPICDIPPMRSFASRSGCSSATRWNWCKSADVYS